MSLKSFLIKAIFICAVFSISFFILSQFENDVPKRSVANQVGSVSKVEKVETSNDSSYVSGKGDRWDAVINDVYDDVGKEAGSSKKEIDAMLRALE